MDSEKGEDKLQLHPKISSDNTMENEEDSSGSNLLNSKIQNSELPDDIKRKMPGLEKIRQTARNNTPPPEKLTKGEFFFFFVFCSNV